VRRPAPASGLIVHRQAVGIHESAVGIREGAGRQGPSPPISHHLPPLTSPLTSHLPLLTSHFSPQTIFVYEAGKIVPGQELMMLSPKPAID